MGTFDLKAGLLTSPDDHAAAFTDGTAPVLRLGQTLVLLPCGSKRGWPEDERHGQLLERMKALGGRVVTVGSELEPRTVDAPAGRATWLVMRVADREHSISDPEREAIVRLPLNGILLHLTVTDTYPPLSQWTCVVRLPPGLNLADAEWCGRLVPEAADD